jgi:hypothetical protein
MLLLLGGVALAQNPPAEKAAVEEAADETPPQGSNRFFFDEPESDESLDKTAYDGSVTSTTVYYHEQSGQPEGLANTPQASPVDRLFTDLRLQFDADHISGGRWDLHSDVRFRYVPGSCRDIRQDPPPVLNPCTRFQSGTFSGHELDARELYMRRGGDTVDWTFGRQYVLDIAATKVDGFRWEQGAGDWKLIVFGGGAPNRISRDIRDDYPELPNVPEGTGSKRALQVVGGGGAAYRFENYYGAFGGAVIFPISNQRDQAREDPRTYLTSNGYYRMSSNLDFYHYAVVDVTGSNAPTVTNLNAGINYRIASALRTYAQVTRIDTETLTTIAEAHLEDPGSQIAGAIQNNIEVMRIAAESARLGASYSFSENRFELASTLTLRRRPTIQVRDQAGMVAAEILSAEATDGSLQFIDRRSILGLRLGVTASYSFGGVPFNLFGGDRNMDRGENLILTVNGTRSLFDGRGDLDTYVTVLQSNDETRATECDPATIESCYGTASIQTLGAGTVLHWRFLEDWFIVGGLNAAVQRFNTVVGGVQQTQPLMISTSLFTRLAYRF